MTPHGSSRWSIVIPDACIHLIGLDELQPASVSQTSNNWPYEFFLRLVKLFLNATSVSSDKFSGYLVACTCLRE